MKILHVLYSGLGGQGNVFLSLVRADKNKTYKYEALFHGVEVLKNEYINQCVTAGVPFSYISKKAGWHMRFFFRVFRAVLKSDANIVFLHGSMLIYPVWLANIFSRKKKYIIIRETQALHLKSRREETALKTAMELANRIIFLSKDYANDVKKQLGRKYNAAKTDIIPNGIDLDFFSPSKKNTASSEFVMGMQSRIVQIKDHKTLLAAFAKTVSDNPAKTLKLRIAGDGEMLSALKQLAVSLGITELVEFTGMLPEKSLPHFLNSLDLYIHASFGETMSTAIMQAMACEKPIIASDVEGINNMLTDLKTGVLVAPSDINLLAEAIWKIYNDKTFSRMLAENALEYARKNFSQTRMFDQYSLIFKSAS